MSAEASASKIASAVRLPEVLQKIDSLLGLRYQPHQWSDLLRLLKPAARELGYADLEDFLTRLAKGDKDEKTLNVLAKHLTIGESYFFREIVVFSILRERILPEMLERKRAQGERSVRVWSAGCSTGEEVYSIAILLDSFLSDLPDWQFTVLGTDVNPVAVERAREGVYRDWSFRDVPMDIHAAYFERTEDGKHAVVERIKQRTEFRQLNLVTAPALFPTGFDMIFCRNVMLYFTREKVSSVVQGFRRSLRENGWLIPSLTETTLINNPGFEGERFGDATLYRKQPHVPKLFSLPQASDAKEREEEPVPSRGLRNPFAALFSLRGGADTQTEDRQDTDAFDEELSDGLTIAADAVPKSSATPAETANAQTAPVRDAVVGDVVHKKILKARRHADAGQLDLARDAAKEAIALNKMEPQAHYMFGTILRESGETTQALQAFERALYLNQDFIPAHFSIATLYHQLGGDLKARRHFGIAKHLLEVHGDMDILLEPGDISARHMLDIIKTFLER